MPAMVKLIEYDDETVMELMDFILNNRDAFGDSIEWLKEILIALDGRGVYHGGGGSEPEWTLELMPRQEN